MNILVIEDENITRDAIIKSLSSEKYDTKEALDGETALQLLKKDKFDLVLLNMSTPLVKDVEFFKKLRALSNLPIIIITTKANEIDELISSEAGADDYIKKPFNHAVLLARIKALLKRPETGKVEVHDLSLDPNFSNVKKHSKILNLTTTQFNILYELALNPGKVYSREMLLDKVYFGRRNEELILERTIDSHIKNIRKAIEDDMLDPQYIITVTGRGYKFK